MRKFTLVAVAALGLPAAARAAVGPICPEIRTDQSNQVADELKADPKAVPLDQRPLPEVPTGCFKDDVLVLSGEGLVKCVETMGKLDPGNCSFDAHEAANKVEQFLKEKNIRSEFDQLVMFGAEVSPPSASAPAPVFYREGFREGVSNGVNEVGGIGLKTEMRKAGRPWVGYIHAGGVPGGNLSRDPFGLCGRAPRRDTDPPAAQPNKALCFPNYSFFEALAQATGAQFGPYLTLGMGKGELSVFPAMKKDAFTKPMVDEAAQPRIWNSFLNTGGSLFGGNNYRDNGNGTYEVTRWSPYYGVNIPVPSDYSASNAPNGTPKPRFMELDLYLMGFLPWQDICKPSNTGRLAAGCAAPGVLQSFMDTKVEQIYRPTITKFEPTVGPDMGYRPGGVAIKPIDIKKAVLPVTDIMMANGERMPAYAQARHFIRQLWVVFTKPKAAIEAAIVPKTKPEDMAKEVRARFNSQHSAVDNVAVMRRRFNSFFYYAAQYRGRLVTTVEGDIDDNAYFEFGNPDDDKRTFAAAGGVAIEVPGWEDAAIPPERKNVLRVVSSPGEGGVIRFQPQPLKLRISGDQGYHVKTVNNSITIRIRISPAVDLPKGAFATLTLTRGGQPGPSFRIPATCGNPARENCKEEGTLIADGKWRNYSASLIDEEGFTGGKDWVKKTALAQGNKPTAPEFDGFILEPSSEPFERPNGAAPDDAMEIEFIRIGNVPSAKDSDEFCVPCKDCKKWKDDKSCDADCRGKGPNDKVDVPRPDGWIDSEDNCPFRYNPDQRDGNEDGVGDACEDYDGDSVDNACDNCPTTTNSRQRDRDSDGQGDVCDGATSSTGCFLTPDAVAGPGAGTTPGLVVAAGFGALAGLLALRRRRRR